MRNLLLILVGAAATYGADFEWQGKLTSGQLIEVRGVHGSIIANGVPGTTASVTAVKSGGKSDAVSVTIQLVPYSGGVVICAMYPDAETSEHPNSCNPPGMDTYLSANDNDVRVDFTVTVPSGVLLSATTLDGDVQANSLSAHVDAHALSGTISISTTGSAQASTLHGPITAAIGSTQWKGSQIFDAGGGDLTLQIPSDANTDVRAMAFMGTITSDFPLTINSSLSGVSSTANGAIGTGGRSLNLSAFRGSIVLQQGPPSGH